ncbi:lantibiotic immunity ABC transporter MutG family permease subunit [Massilioclostridium coli]|uniref:lantibiotic immunity ABC transporter MutG family permease subunit n=1 Tax=Massilioclostridium coli TaxID=1870991 RepID=UPI00085BB3D3|nr:lantibiotic immunity ABC transporter MutG family permease subunit [Massilioclostridium coli]
MIEYFRYLKSDWYKLQHTRFFLLHLLFPVCGASFMLLYARISGSSDLNKLVAFAQILAIAYPFVISIVCQIAADQEMRAGHFQNMLTQPNRVKTIVSKFTWLILSGFIAIVISTAIFGTLFPFITGSNVPMGFFIVIPLVLWTSNIPLYGFHTILAFRFGRNLGVSVGAVGSLLSALLQTGLGTGIWYVIPYGWCIRFSESALAWLFHIPVAGMTEIQFGIFFCILCTYVIIIGMIAWFKRYSGMYTE